MVSHLYRLNRSLISSCNFFTTVNKIFIKNSECVVPVCVSCFHKSSNTCVLPFGTSGILKEQRNHIILTHLIQCREKKTKSSSEEYVSDSDSDEDVEKIPGSKVIQVQLSSLRWDTVVKNGLGISRNKLAVLFYESRIRINGEKVLKKSHDVTLGDEIDIIKDFNTENPNFINVSRVEILKARPTGDIILLTIRKHKSLLIENYENAPWVETEQKDSEE